MKRKRASVRQVHISTSKPSVTRPAYALVSFQVWTRRSVFGQGRVSLNQVSTMREPMMEAGERKSKPKLRVVSWRSRSQFPPATFWCVKLNKREQRAWAAQGTTCVMYGGAVEHFVQNNLFLFPFIKDFHSMERY